LVTGTPRSSSNPTGPGSRALASGSGDSDDRNGSFGFISRVRIRRSMYRQATCSKQRRPGKISASGADRNVGGGSTTSRPRRCRRDSGGRDSRPVLEAALTRHCCRSRLMLRCSIRRGIAARYFRDRVRAEIRTITLVAVGALFATVWSEPPGILPEHLLLIDFTYPLLSTTAIYTHLIFFAFVREQSQRRQIRSAFGQYLSPAWSSSSRSRGKTQLAAKSRDDHHVLRRRASPPSRNHTSMIRRV